MQPLPIGEIGCAIRKDNQRRGADAQVQRGGSEVLIVLAGAKGGCPLVPVNTILRKSANQLQYALFAAGRHDRNR